MIEINLLPEELQKKEAVKIALPEIPVKKTLMGVGAAVLVIQVFLTLLAFYLHFEEISIGRTISSLKDQNKEIVRQKAETVGLHNRLKEIRSFSSRKFYWTSLLNALSFSMTKGVWLRSFYVVEEEGRPAPKSADAKKPDKSVGHEWYLVLEGSAMGAGQETALLGKFLKELKDNAYFNELFVDLKPSNINQKRLGDYEVYEFMVRAHFRKDRIG